MTWITDVKYNKNFSHTPKYRSNSNPSILYGDGADNTNSGGKIPDLNEIILQERSKIFSKQDKELGILEMKLQRLQQEVAQQELERKINFLQLQKHRAIQYEIADIQNRMEFLQNQNNVKKFDRIVQPYLQAYTHEEEIYSMERNAPRRNRIRASQRQMLSSSEMKKGEPNTGTAGSTILIGREDSSRDKRMNIIVNECLSEVRAKHPPPIIQSVVNHCPTCKLPYVLVTALAAMVCQKCGRKQNNHIDATISCPYGRETDNSFHYKRINHLNESLMLFQAKESTVIPKEVLEKTMVRLYESGNIDQLKINRWKIRDAWRDLGLRKG